MPVPEPEPTAAVPAPEPGPLPVVEQGLTETVAAEAAAVAPPAGREMAAAACPAVACWQLPPAMEPAWTARGASAEA